jgi:hypothetical protein
MQDVSNVELAYSLVSDASCTMDPTLLATFHKFISLQRYPSTTLQWKIRLTRCLIRCLTVFTQGTRRHCLCPGCNDCDPERRKRLVLIIRGGMWASFQITFSVFGKKIWFLGHLSPYRHGVVSLFIGQSIKVHSRVGVYDMASQNGVTWNVARNRGRCGY